VVFIHFLTSTLLCINLALLDIELKLDILFGFQVTISNFMIIRYRPRHFTSADEILLFINLMRFIIGILHIRGYGPAHPPVYV
jgi:hypothetical protein